MSGRGFLISVDSVDSLCEYQEHATTPKTPRSPNAYGNRLDYFDKSYKGKFHKCRICHRLRQVVYHIAYSLTICRIFAFNQLKLIFFKINSFAYLNVLPLTSSLYEVIIYEFIEDFSADAVIHILSSKKFSYMYKQRPNLKT